MKTTDIFSRAAVVLAAAAVGSTVLVTCSGVPADLQDRQWMWLCAALLCAVPAWTAGFLRDPRTACCTLSGSAEWVLMSFGAAEALHGLGQIAGVWPSNHSLFVLTGTFYNPGPYSGYLAAAVPIALHRMLVTEGKSDRLSAVQHRLSVFVLLLTGCVLPAGMSRAAWIASLASCGYVAFRLYRVKVMTFVSAHRHAVWGVLAFGVLLATGAYAMKRGSADGRLLIWKVTARAIADNPWGEENGRTFSALYGDAQERYFTDCEYSESEAWIAGTPDFAFNEYLQIAAEQGIAAAVAFVALLAFLLGVAGRDDRLAGLGGCLVSLAVFACFSYPLRIPASVSAWALAGASLLLEGLAVMGRKARSGAVLVAAAAAVAWTAAGYDRHSGRLQAVRGWMPVRALYHSGAFGAAADAYGKLYGRMSWNKDFCFEYGRALYRAGHHGKAEGVLLESLKVSGDPMILNILGRNAQENGEYEKAERYLLRSTRRLPGRIYPHYLLVKLYAESECFDKVKLIREAEYVLNAEPKVNSTAIREMRQEVKGILERQGITTGGSAVYRKTDKR